MQIQMQTPHSIGQSSESESYVVSSFESLEKLFNIFPPFSFGTNKKKKLSGTCLISNKDIHCHLAFFHTILIFTLSQDQNGEEVAE